MPQASSSTTSVAASESEMQPTKMDASSFSRIEPRHTCLLTVLAMFSMTRRRHSLDMLCQNMIGESSVWPAPEREQNSSVCGLQFSRSSSPATPLFIFRPEDFSEKASDRRDAGSLVKTIVHQRRVMCFAAAAFTLTSNNNAKYVPRPPIPLITETENSYRPYCTK